MTEGPHRLAVIGAGPAGLAASLAAAARGIQVTLIDSAVAVGGQFYRRPASGLGARRPRALHHRWHTWERLERGLAGHLEAGTVRHLTDHHVWLVERAGATGARPGFTVHALLGPLQEESVALRADAVLLATGGYEKVLPFPGWTLPGVVTAGGAQALLKGGLVVPGHRAVVAGSGPLLLPVATSLAAAGVEVAALVESLDPRRLPRGGGALAAEPGKIAEAVLYAARLLRHRVPFVPRHTVVEAHGEGRLEAVTVGALGPDGRVRPGTERRIPCEALAVGHGMVPHTDLAEALGCRTDASGVDVDEEQRTDVPGVWAAGETTGIGGAALSLAEGHLAGRSVAARLRGVEPDPRSAARAVRVRARARAFASALDAVYRPPAHWAEQVTDETVVCRCEEVTAGRVREAVTDLGAGDVRTVKLLTRAGMGWCQGRICEPAVAGLAGCEQVPARRLLARPVPLGVLARAGADDDDPSPGTGPPPGLC
ncbi:FAD-dependent oxidoreductase [Streptomyces sp. NPDC058122]|uniref:FAD-dependent oxidoreductase n=1 Tax=Streptomyces sp. NPDC058122 TaxID=3346349 RepID=UPI0036DFE129